MVIQSKHYNLRTGYIKNMKNTLKHKNLMLQVQVRVPVGNLNLSILLKYQNLLNFEDPVSPVLSITCLAEQILFACICMCVCLCVSVTNMTQEWMVLLLSNYQEIIVICIP